MIPQHLWLCFKAVHFRRYTLSICLVFIQSDTSAFCFQFRYGTFKDQFTLSYPFKSYNRSRNCTAN